MDFYCTLKYITKNADKLGIDPNRLVRSKNTSSVVCRIAIGGESGGGYLGEFLLSPPYIVAVCGTMVLLAQREESHLVKLALPLVPMVSDYSFHDTAGMTREEAGQAATQRIFWELLAGAIPVSSLVHNPS